MNAFIVTNDKFRDYIDGLFASISEGNQKLNKKKDKKGKNKEASPQKGNDNILVDKS